MAQTLVNLLVHLVFSTKDRQRLITTEIEPNLFAYMAGILKKLDSACLTINGAGDHVHLLIAQSKNIALSRLVGELKKSSSKWIKTKVPSLRRFGWQDGYGAFSVSPSKVEAVKDYIVRQKEHHNRESFQDELIEILKKHGVEYDERYLWK